MAWSAGAILTAAQLNTYAPQAWSSWTPTLTAETGGFTLASATGRYIAHGKTIVWQATITITTAGTAAGACIFTLPVAAAAVSALGSGRENASTGAALQVWTTTGATGRVLRYDNTTAIANSRTLLVGGSYES
jgi:hypothetical protein